MIGPYPKLDLTPFSPEYINKIVGDSVQRNTIEDLLIDVQRVLKILELPEYREHNPEYSNEDIRFLVIKFTSIFRGLLLEKAKKSETIYTAYNND
jgi:hypothetical protein